MYYAPIQERILLVEERMRSQADGHHPDLGAALDHLLSSGGKRIRPTVTLLVGGMLEANADHLINLAAAIELLHTATLVHDDLIDGALLRRGIPTLNSQWAPAATVLTGDFIFARAAKLAADTNSVEVMRLFAETLATIVSGEITQMFSSQYESHRQEYYQRIYAKTASMFELASISPALLSEADGEIIATTRIFGQEIGLAFQIVDDILDFTGEEVTVGKPVASDLRQGIITLPTICYLETHPEDVEIKHLQRGQYLSEERIVRLATNIRRSDAIRAALQEAKNHVNRALDALADLPVSLEREALEELARYIVRRQL